MDDYFIDQFYISGELSVTSSVRFSYDLPKLNLKGVLHMENHSSHLK